MTVTVDVQPPPTPPIVIVLPSQTPAALEIAPPGLPGPPGPAGAPGERGTPGTDLYVRYEQRVPESVWTIRHRLGIVPAITVVDSAHQQVFGSVMYPDLDTAVVSFAAAFSGTAYLL